MSHSATATVTRRFHGVQDGHVYPRWFEVGETITGDLAAAMISSGDALDPSAEPVGPPLPVGNAVHAAAPLGVVTAPPGPDPVSYTHLKGPFDSKDDAVAALEEKGA